MRSVENPFRAALPAVVLLMLGSFAATPALAADAQAQGAAPANALEEVVVTAQFREERAQDTPIAITALSAQALEQNGVTDLVGAGNLAPNVALTKGSGVGAFSQMASVFIRGVGQSDPHFAVEPGVGVYIDDVYFGVVPGAMFQLLDTDRVEVLRGPQGTLSGKNSIGGSIKLYSKQPGAAQDGYVEAQYGSYDRLGGRAAATLTLVDDTMFARIAVSGVRANGYMKRFDYACVTGTSPTFRLGQSCQLGTEGGQNTITGRAALRWVPSDRLEDTLSVDAIDDDSENPAMKQLAQLPSWTGGANYITCPTCYSNYENFISKVVSGPSRGSTFPLPTTTPLHGWGVSNRLHYEITPSLRLDSISAERQSTVVFVSTDEASPASIADQLWRLAHKEFTQELRLSGEYGRQFEWTFGLFYYDARGSSGGRVNIPFGLSVGGGDALTVAPGVVVPLGIADDILFTDPVHTKNKSVFLHTTTHPTEKLGINLDGRYSKDSKDFTFNRWNSLGEPNPAIPGLIDLTRSYSGSRFDYRVGVDYQWAPDFLTYAQLSTGYKGGGVNPRPFFTTQAITYNPEKLTAYEVGLKSEFFERTVLLNLAAFYDTYKNFQGTLLRCDAFSPFPGAPCAMTTNVGDAHISGVELETKLRIASSLSIDASLGWTDFKYTSVNPATGVQLSDKNVFTPNFTANAGIQYAVALGAAGTLTPRLDGSYRAAMYSNFINDSTNRVPPVGLINARLIWENDHHRWQATLAVTNLAGRFYYTSVLSPDGPHPVLPLFGGSILGAVGEPREVLLTVRRSFGP